MAQVRHARKAWRLADGLRQASGGRSLPPQQARRPQARRARLRAGDRAGHTARPRRGARRCRRRSPPPYLHLLPPDPLARGARGADAPFAGRIDHGGDCPRLPRAGDDWMRPQLCQEALRLGRILAELVREEPEVHGLVALMEIQASRFETRTSPSGEPILLLDQNRTRWDQLLIRRGLAALERAETLARESGRGSGPYALQAPIAACHARARTAEETDWARIVGLYGALGEIAPSPIAELNRAVALAMLFGPKAGLEIVDALTSEPVLKTYHLLPSVRGDLLKKLGRLGEARAEFERAAGLTRNERERKLLLDRAAACGNQIRTDVANH